jgi:hypothetical protein
MLLNATEKYILYINYHKYSFSYSVRHSAESNTASVTIQWRLLIRNEQAADDYVLTLAHIYCDENRCKLFKEF